MKDHLERIFRGIFLARPALTILAALILGPAAFLFYQCYYSPDVPFIHHHSGAAWIRYPEPVSTFTRVYTDTVHFSKEFAIEQIPREKVFVYLKAFKEAQLYVNGFAVSVQQKNWKKGTKIEISPWIKLGTNSIRTEVQNPLGPALFWLKIEGLKNAIATDATWETRIKTGPYVQAILADDTRTYPESQTVPSTYHSFRKKGAAIFLIFLASIGLWALGRFFFKGSGMKILPWAAFAGILMVWIYLFLAKMVKVGPDIGFDPTNHLDYIIYIIRNKRIPLPTEGWSMFHPPFFYLLSAGFFRILNSFLSWVSPFHAAKGNFFPLRSWECGGGLCFGPNGFQR